MEAVPSSFIFWIAEVAQWGIQRLMDYLCNPGHKTPEQDYCFLSHCDWLLSIHTLTNNWKPCKTSDLAYFCLLPAPPSLFPLSLKFSWCDILKKNHPLLKTWKVWAESQVTSFSRVLFAIYNLVFFLYSAANFFNGYLENAMCSLGKTHTESINWADRIPTCLCAKLCRDLFSY